MSFITIDNSRFYNQTGIMGAFLYIWMKSIINIYRTNFTGGISEEMGGAISAMESIVYL